VKLTNTPRGKDECRKQKTENRPQIQWAKTKHNWNLGVAPVRKMMMFSLKAGAQCGSVDATVDVSRI
jgi:hypothetical protein